MDERADGLTRSSADRGDSEGSNSNAAIPGTDTAGDDMSVEEIRAEIEETRAEMSETIEAIQEKLSPQHIKAEVKEKLHGATVGKVHDLAEGAREKLGTTGRKIGEVAGTAAHGAGDKMGAASTTLQERGQVALDAARRNPLSVGLFALGVVSGVWWWMHQRSRY